jgi:DNA polymerase III epsilon subunit-like protein
MSLATARGVWLVDLFESDLTPVLEPLKRKTLVIQNAAFDLGFFAQLGYEHEGELIDTMLLSQLLYSEAAPPPLRKGRRTSHALDAVAERELYTMLDKA